VVAVVDDKKTDWSRRRTSEAQQARPQTLLMPAAADVDLERRAAPMMAGCGRY
jgi:hypothetical protein